MGYRLKRREADLEFSGTDFEGAVIRCRFDVSLDDYFAYQKLAEQKDDQALREVLMQFGDEIVISWNLEDDDGNSIPANGVELCKLPVPFSSAALKGWLEAMSQPAGPLGQRLSGTPTSGEDTTSTETSSQPPQS